MTRHVWMNVACALVTAASAPACIEPSNPCDPGADPALQAEGTRISGIVKDTDGRPLGGIPVAVTGRPDTTVSATDGAFSLANLPPAPSYELIALPQAPSVGGRARTGALACRAQLKDVELVVVVPPASPEVELVKASGDKRLLVAFGGVEPIEPEEMTGMYDKKDTEESAGAYRDPADVMTDCTSGLVTGDVSFRVQVRSPFGAWHDAVLTPFPWSASPPPDDVDTTEVDERMAAAALATSDMYTERVDDRCAAALCSQFSHLDDALAEPLARCAEVVGMIEDDGGIEPLEAFASYHVRVLSEKKTPEALRATAALPERVEGAAAASTGQMSLVPGALLPVANSDGTLHDAHADDVLAVVPTAGGRFAVVSHEAVMVVGDGADTMDEAARENFDGMQNASAMDGSASESATTTMTDGATDVRPLSVLAAGQWARVMRKGEAGPTSIKKLYMGTDAADASNGPELIEAAKNELEPELLFDVESPSLGAPRALGYLMRPAGSIAQDTMAPDDAYLLLYPHTFVLVEQRRPTPDAGGNPLAEMALAHFTPAGPAHAVSGAFTGTWADRADTDRVNRVGIDGQSAAFSGGCQLLRDELDSDGDGISNTLDFDADGDGQDDADQLDFVPLPAEFGDVELVSGDVVSRRTAVCYDMQSALDEEVDLVDVEVLDDASGVIEDAVHLITDARNDRVFAVKTRDLVCKDCTADEPPLARRLLDDAVNVGREPTGMSRSKLIQGCRAEDPPPTPVVLIANRRGGDVSVLTANGGVVTELEIVPMPANIVGFLDDADGPTCEDPFAWALGEDGRVFPIDMRGGPSVPLCDGRPCEVGTRGRAVAGAVGRRPAGPLEGRARSIVGGPGLIGELGFSKPKALTGEAFTEPDQFQDEAVRSEPVDPEP